MTCGRISASANSRTLRRSRCWSSVKRKSIDRTVSQAGAAGLGGRHVVRRPRIARRDSVGPRPGRDFAYTRSMKRILVALCSSCSVPAPAFADITAFLGVNPTPVSRPVRGFAVGHRPADRRLRVRIREHQRRAGRQLAKGRAAVADLHGQRAGADADSDRRHAVLRDGGRRRVSGSRSRTTSETHVGINVGGGVKMNAGGAVAAAAGLPGVHAEGIAAPREPQRFYAG